MPIAIDPRGSSDGPNGRYNGLNGQGPASTTKSANGVKNSFLEADSEEAKILEVIDKLRELGVNKEYPLPQIIVCGAQSAGKSSVLEAITKIPFPRDSGVCTKYKTTVTLVRKDEEYVQLTIMPCEDRPQNEQNHLSQFVRNYSKDVWEADGARIMDEAKSEIFKGKNDNSWTKDILSITIAGPGQRSLQLVDLPGIIGVSDVDDDVELVQEMVETEMRSPRSLMLAVVKATDDIQSHTILRLCKRHDSTGKRTLGVITRPDESKEKAAGYINMVMKENPEITVNHEWHVLVNRSHDDLLKKKTAEQRDAKEREFFNMAPWSQLLPKDFGIEALRTKLRERLFSLAKEELPKLQTIMDAEKSRLDKELDGLGGENMNPEERRQVARACLKRLKKVVRESVDGLHKSGLRDARTGGDLHLRARIFDQSEIYRDRMIDSGHAWELEGSGALDPHADVKSVYHNDARIPLTQPEKRPLEAAISKVVERLSETRGAHLPSFHDPRLINEGVWELSENWMQISQMHIDIVFSCCEEFLKGIIPRGFSTRGLSAAAKSGFGNYKDVARRLYRKEVVEALALRKKQAEAELLRLEEDRLEPRQNFDKQFLIDLREHRQTANFARTVDSISKSKAIAEQDGEIGPDGVASAQQRYTQQEQTEECSEVFLSAMRSDYVVSCFISLCSHSRTGH